MGFVYLFLTIACTAYGQLVIKWQIAKAGALPPDLVGKVTFLLGQLTNVWILSGFCGAFLAALSWMAAMTRFELSVASPFTSLTYVFVLIFSILFLGESLTWQKVCGTLLVMFGLFIISRT